MQPTARHLSQRLHPSDHPVHRLSPLFSHLLNPAVPPVPQQQRRYCSAWSTSGVHKGRAPRDRKSTRLNSSHVASSYAVFCLKKKNLHATKTHTTNTFPTLFFTSGPAKGWTQIGVMAFPAAVALLDIRSD